MMAARIHFPTSVPLKSCAQMLVIWRDRVPAYHSSNMNAAVSRIRDIESINERCIVVTRNSYLHN